MSGSVKGFYTALLRNPPQIQAKWDRITHLDFEEVEIIWWHLGQRDVGGPGLVRYSSEIRIPVKLGETYVVAARARYKPYYMPDCGEPGPVQHCIPNPSSSWVYTVVEVPREEAKSQFIDLGELWVMDTSKGPAILLDDLRDALS